MTEGDAETETTDESEGSSRDGPDGGVGDGPSAEQAGQDPTNGEEPGDGDGDTPDSETTGGRDDRGVETGEALVSRIREATAEEVAEEIESLRERADEAEAALADRQERIDELESRVKRKQADFENYKKRMEKRREQERERATEELVERLLEVRDNLARGLEQDEDADIRDGVEATLRQLDRVLDAENVTRIEPTPGDDVDPGRHEVLMRVESDEPADTVADVHRPGYEMADTVLRPAQVTVSEGSPIDDTEEPEDDGPESDGDRD